MRLIGAAVAVALGVASGAAGAAVTEDQFLVRNTGDLVALCGAAQTDPLMTAAVNFCHGFAVGAFRVLQIEQAALQGNQLFCLPDPTPTRSATITGFLQWASANPQRMSLPPADGIAEFLSQRFPCARPR